jgi:SAM-dependent methyltransferase
VADWDKRYRQGDFASLVPNPLLEQAIGGLPTGTALDLGCGAGRHAIYLAERGWHVTAVDRSAVGIDLLRRRANAGELEIDARVADLESHGFTLEPDHYDLICDFYYLQRDLFPEIRRGLKPGGILVAAIHLAPDSSEGESAEHPFVVASGELTRYVQDWKVLHYHETSGIDRDAGQHHKRTAELIARRPKTHNQQSG